LIHVDTVRAVRVYDRARIQDQRMFANYTDLTLARMLLGRPPEALAEADATLRAFPGDPLAATMRARLAGRDNPAAWIGPVKEMAARGQLPPAGYVTLAQHQAEAGQTADAVATLDAVLAQAPNLCEAQAVRAGLLADLGRAARGGSEAIPAEMPPRCAALGAAAVGNAAGAAAQMRRMADDEFALRSWMEIRYGVTGETNWASGTYPWTKVARVPEVVAAHQAIEAAFSRLRRIADEELKGLP
jgi:hypothetical protein